MATPQYVAEMEHRMGLDQPLYIQYERYMTGLLHGDLGESSATGRPVLDDFIQRLPATLELTLASLILAILIGVPLGVLSAIHRDTAIDHFGRVFGVVGRGNAELLEWAHLHLLVFFIVLNIAPAPIGPACARASFPRLRSPASMSLILSRAANWRAFQSSLAQLALPSITLAISVMAPLARMVRAAMLEILETDYIKAAWAAGLPRRRIYYGDALRNAIIPVVTALGLVFGFLMAGNAVVESVFGWPGIGNYAVKALMLKDSSPIQSFVLFVRSCAFWSISPLIRLRPRGPEDPDGMTDRERDRG